VAGHEEHVGSVGDQVPGGGQAQAAGGSGQQVATSGESEVHGPIVAYSSSSSQIRVRRGRGVPAVAAVRSPPVRSRCSRRAKTHTSTNPTGEVSHHWRA